MYEQFKHLIMAELSKDFDVDQLRKISECLDLAAKNFDVVRRRLSRMDRRSQKQ